ncbi:MAG TPA: hypothetical protein VFG89_06850 [Coriobacteriia bacterium]|nr:hypothetical protein [Coriobacteriia bacterium]
MSVQLVVALVSFAVALLIAGLGYLVGKFVDRSRGVTAEQSRESGLVATKGSSPASFGDFRDLPTDDNR